MKRLLTLLLSFFPIFALAAAGSVNFTPPPGDFSVVFLGNVFGIVEGVLRGTGSQILGNMFVVFNSAVMALGGMVIMYTLVVSTMNTAHEGQFLGQKWSSIWVPMRSVFGLALLVPQTSGYCMMQIMVMWVVVQGVGAADKIWDVALSYLNRGGVIVQPQLMPKLSIKAANSEIATGAATILQGQVCMLGLQKILQNLHDELNKDAQENKSGLCYQPSSEMKGFCERPVPDFLSTFNAVTHQQEQSIPGKRPPSTYLIDMPHFAQDDSLYGSLEGVCGTITWNDFAVQHKGDFERIAPAGEGQNAARTAELLAEAPGKVIAGEGNAIQKVAQLKQAKAEIAAGETLEVSSAELETAKLTRAIAIQQMYVDLATVAQSIVNNSPLLHPRPNDVNTKPAVPGLAYDQFGIPKMSSGSPCRANSEDCVDWGGDSTLKTAPLFNGTEFQGAVADYNTIMLPTLRLIEAAKQAASQNGVRSFISKAKKEGWIMAGSYFFYLARLNAVTAAAGEPLDTDVGLKGSSSPIDGLNGAIAAGVGCTPAESLRCRCEGGKQYLCYWLNGDATSIKQLTNLINGSLVSSMSKGTSTVTSTPVDSAQQPGATPVTGDPSSTVNGLIINSLFLNLPGQPGMHPPQFTMKFNLEVSPGALTMPELSFPCGYAPIIGCFGETLANLFYNILLRNIFMMLINLAVNVGNQVVISVLSLPLLGGAQIFLQGVSVIQHPEVNPILALANMGVMYINFAAELWMTISMLFLMASLIPVFNFVIVPILAIIMPLVMSWLMIMVGIGFVNAYYIPFVPYMVFTFGAIGWLIAVIEAMVAAPIVALGVCFPEGHEAFGKAEAAVMLIMNVFLRPAMMIMGYISAIILSYVAIWIINAGFANALVFIQGDPNGSAWNSDLSNAGNFNTQSNGSTAGKIDFARGYSGWAGIFGFFFPLVLYTSIYATAVQESFNLITILPDKILRWLGGQAETIGAETSKWADQAKGQLSEAGKDTAKASQVMGGEMKRGIQEEVSKLAGGGKTPGTTGSSTPSS